MAVIVDDRNAIPLAGAGETPTHAAEAGERLADGVVSDSEGMHDRDRRGGIERVVPPWHRQRQAADLVRGLAGAIAEHHSETRRTIGVVEIDQPHVGLRIFAVSDDAAVLDAADKLLHHW